MDDQRAVNFKDDFIVALMYIRISARILF